MRNRALTLLISLPVLALAVAWTSLPQTLRDVCCSDQGETDTRNSDASLDNAYAAHRQIGPSPTSSSAAARPLMPHKSLARSAKAAAANANSQTRPTSPRPDPASPPLRERLEAATRRARAERNLVIDPTVVPIALREGAVRVLLSSDFEFVIPSTLSALASAPRAEFRSFPLLGSAAARLSPEALLQLIDSTEIARIELDAVHRPSLIDSIELIGADQLHSANYDGDGYAVAILDTGIDLEHPLFAERIIEEACFSARDGCPNGERTMVGEGAAAPCALGGCSHGTHVAGILAADDPTSPLRGAAPHASLIAVQIFSDVDGSAGAYTSDILAGLQHVLALADFHAIAAANLSFGSGEFEGNCDSSTALFKAVRRLREAGIATVAAAGNDASTVALSSPACLSNVLGVSSVNDDDTVSSFSNTSASLSFLAPGRSIKSSAVGGGTAFNSGTSMATPHVAGTIASLREAHPDASVADLENALALSGLPIIDARSGLTFPRIRAQEALELLSALAAESPEGEAPLPEASAGASGSLSAASPKSGGGGGGCGLVGIEPFLILGVIRRPRSLLRRKRA